MLRKCLSAWVAVAPLPSAAWAQLPLVEHGASGWVARIDESWIEGQVGLDLDGQGRPHVVYGVFEEGLRWELWYQRWDPISRRWLPDEPLVEDILCDAYPDIAVEADGTAHIVYCDGTEDDGGAADPYGAMYCRVPPGGVACAERRLVHPGVRDWRGGHGIVLGDQGQPTVVFQDAFTGNVHVKTRAAFDWPGLPELVFDCEGLDERCCQGLSKPSLDFSPSGIPAVSCGNIDNFDARDGDALPGPRPVIGPAIHTAWKSAGAWVYDADPPVGPVGGPWVQAFAVGGDTWLGQTWFDASPGVGAVKYREAKIGSGWASATIESSLAGGFGDVATDLKVEDSGAMAVAYNEAGLAKTLRYARRDGPGITNFTPGFVDGHCEHHMRWLDLELSPDTDESPRTFYRSSRSNPQAAFDAKYTAWDDEPWPFAQPPGPPPGAVIDGATGSASDRIDPGQPHATGDRWICYREAVGWPIPQYDLYLLRWDGKDRVWDPAELIKADVGPAPDDAGRHCAVAVWEPDGGGARKVGIAYADSSGAGSDLQFRESVGGGPWGGPPAVDQTLGHLDLQYLADGRAAVAYRNGPGEPAYGEIWNDGAWNQQMVVVRPGLGGSVHMSLALDQPRERPRLSFSRGGDLHLVWPTAFNNFNWPVVAANEQIWAGESSADTSLLILPCCPVNDPQCAATAPECGDMQPGGAFEGVDVFLAYRDASADEVLMYACSGLPDDPPANCAGSTVDAGGHQDICGLGTSCEVGAYLDGEFDGYWTPSYSYRNYSLAGANPGLPDLGVVSTRWNPVDDGWAVCDTAKGGHFGSLSLDRYGNPLVGSTEFVTQTPLRGFWWP